MTRFDGNYSGPTEGTEVFATKEHKRAQNGKGIFNHGWTLINTDYLQEVTKETKGERIYGEAGHEICEIQEREMNGKLFEVMGMLQPIQPARRPFTLADLEVDRQSLDSLPQK
jgi:hypothetical protein